MKSIKKGILDDFNKNCGEDYILFYKIVFNEVTKFPDHTEAIKIDRDLHVELQFNGNSLPFPCWFTHGHNVKLIYIFCLFFNEKFIQFNYIESKNFIRIIFSLVLNFQIDI